MRKNPISLFMLLACYAPTTRAQTLRQPLSAVYLGLNAYSTKHTDVFSFVHSQASLAQIKDPAAGVYGERRFSLAAVDVYTAAIAIPTSKGNFGIDLNTIGFDNYNENRIGFAYARSLGSKTDIGIQFNHYAYRIPYYGGDEAVNVEFGLITHLTDQLNMGIHLYNPVGGNFSKTGEKLSTVYTMGLGYDASENLYVATEFIKEESFPVNVNAGVQYRFEKQFFARAGISTATSTTYMGFGVSWDIFRIDISASFHPQLGVSPGLLFIVNLNKKQHA
jgi:hypothetical protein